MRQQQQQQHESEQIWVEAVKQSKSKWQSAENYEITKKHMYIRVDKKLRFFMLEN